MEPRILHIDMDAFFASVEQQRDPTLRGKPLIIGGNVDDRRGVVSTASYEAREFGVHSAMPISEARRLCPHGIFMRGTRGLYSEVSGQVRAILNTVSPLVEMASIDEAYVDVTGSQRLFGGDDDIAAHIKKTIRDQTGLTCTIAISPNRLLSKIGSDYAKPDGYIRIEAEHGADFLAPMSIGKMPGIGPRTRESLERKGIHTLGQLAAMQDDALDRLLGNHAHSLRRRARGIGSAKVIPRSDPKSISRETTFSKDRTDWADIERVLFGLTEDTLRSLRKKEMETRRVVLKVRYEGFETHTLNTTLPEPTRLSHDVFDALHRLIPKARVGNRPVRLIGVGLGSLSRGQSQLSLLDPERDEKWQRATDSVDEIQERYGAGSLRSARSIPKPESESS